mmetsp:Transcript_103259/g.277377  ORF Transcript_103259/g.277377 Transcript_103259/m.277377 type:complete len:215 (-) Transcript_103259:622-1266(-)
MELLTSRPRRGPKNLTEQLNQVIARGRECESKALLTPIELHVVLAHEDVAQDPHGLAHVDGLDAQDAHVADALNHEVLRGQREVLAPEREGERGQLRGAADHIQALEGVRTDHRHDGLDLHLRARKHRSARVHDGHWSGRNRQDAAELHGVQGDGPPSLAHHVQPGEFARHVRGVDAAENQLPRHVAGQVETEHRFLELARLHQSLHDREAGAP